MSRPRAWRTIARTTLHELLRDRRLTVLALALVVIGLAALATSAIEVQARSRAIAAAHAADEAAWIDQGPKSPHSAAHFGRMVYRPTPPLAWLERGLDAYLGTVVWLEAHWYNPFQLRPAEERPPSLHGTDGGLGWILQVVVALPVLILSVVTIGRQRERGIAALTASQGVPPAQFVGGVAAGVAGGAILSALPLLVGAAGFALWLEPSLDTGLRLLVFLGVHVVWLVLLAMLGVTIGSFVDSTQRAVGVAFAAWVTWCLLIPRFASEVAELRAPTPHPRAFYGAIAEDQSQGINGHAPADERRVALERQVLEQYGVESTDQLPVSFAGIALQASEEYGDQVFDRHFGALWAAWQQQQNIQRWSGLLSPMTAVRSLSMAISGTDVTHHRLFAEAAEAHRRELVAFLNGDMINNAVGRDFEYLADTSLWERSPTFSWRTPSIVESLRSGAAAVAILLGWAIGAIFLLRRSASVFERQTLGRKP